MTSLLVFFLKFLIKCNCGNQAANPQAQLFIINSISFQDEHLIFELSELSTLPVYGFRYFEGYLSVLCELTVLVGERHGESVKGTGPCKLFQSASFSPLSIRPRRRRECRVSCNYSPMNFRLFRDLFRFSYREEDRSRRSYLADIPLQCPREWDRIAVAVPRN